MLLCCFLFYLYLDTTYRTVSFALQTVLKVYIIILIIVVSYRPWDDIILRQSVTYT